MKYSLNYARTIYYNIEVEADTLEDAEVSAETDLENSADFYEVGADSFLLEGWHEIED